ncbi:MAG TPA: hypothetical protein VIB39_03445 [Candidatus Angelobacter sp.]|jgi:hypothetical protein
MTLSPNEKYEHPISLAIEGGSLVCRRHQCEVWRFSVDKLLLLAEYTNDHGPMFNDYYFVFWSREDGQLWEATVSFYAEGRDTALEVLSKRLNADLSLGLTGSTEWASRVVWPPELAGHPYFAFREVLPATWPQTLGRRCFGPALEYFLTEEVQDHLNRYSAS